MPKRRQYRIHEEKTKYTSSMSASKHKKHWPRKGAKRVAQFDKMIADSEATRELELLPLLAKVTQSIPADWDGPRPVTMRSLGGWVPTQGDGTTDTGENWYFRFRSDTVSLRVFGDNLLEPRLDVVCSPLTGDPYAGALDLDEAVALITALWPRLATPSSEYISPDGLRELVRIPDVAEGTDSGQIYRA